MDTAKELSIYKRYWIYSKTEEDLIKQVSNGVSSSKIKLGTVISNGGVAKNYTSIINDPSKTRYSDSTIVAEGDIRKVVYTQPEVW